MKKEDIINIQDVEVILTLGGVKVRYKDKTYDFLSENCPEIIAYTSIIAALLGIGAMNHISKGAMGPLICRNMDLNQPLYE